MTQNCLSHDRQMGRPRLGLGLGLPMAWEMLVSINLDLRVSTKQIQYEGDNNLVLFNYFEAGILSRPSVQSRPRGEWGNPKHLLIRPTRSW